MGTSFRFRSPKGGKGLKRFTRIQVGVAGVAHFKKRSPLSEIRSDKAMYTLSGFAAKLTRNDLVSE